MSRATSPRTLAALACLTLLLFCAAEARACSCVEREVPPCAAYWRADAVFVGVVTEIIKPEKDTGSLPKALLRFRVEDAYRGVTSAELEVVTLSGTSCDLGFDKGERWLVYGYRDGETGRLEAHPCTRTHFISGDSEDLAYIRGLKRGKPEQSVLGRLLQHRYKPLAGMKVTAKGGGQSFESLTDGEGGYGFALPKPGTYTVRAVLPFSAGAVSYNLNIEAQPTDDQTVLEYNVNLTAGQCAYNEIDVYEVDLHATAEVSGKVLDEEGQPVTHGRVYLVDAAPKEGSKPWRQDGQISPDGSFKFDGVAVGRYYLAINPDDEAPGQSDSPHPRTFHPGVADASHATPLVVTEGLKLEGITFRVRPAMKGRVVTGSVVWDDGSPIPEASVSLYDGGADRYIRMVKADAEGRFSLEVFGDFKYELTASAYHGERYGQSEKVKVPPAGQPANVKLVIKPKK